MYKAIATDDSVNTCDCCGKSNLKHTVVMERDDGELFHFGSVCATKHSGFSSGVIKKQIDAVLQEKKDKACKEYKHSKEKLDVDAKHYMASKQGLIGVAFREFCRAEQEAAATKRKEIAAKYGIEAYQVQ
jgi:hypothetical protein